MHALHWREFFGFIFVQAMTFIVPLVYVIHYKFHDKGNRIRPNLSHRFWSIVLILQGLAYLYFGFSSQVLHDRNDQILSWFELVIGFFGVGAIYLFWSFKMRITCNNDQINFCWAFRKTQAVLWSDIAEITRNDWRNSIEILLKTGRKIFILHDWYNAALLLNEAIHKNILVSGYDYEGSP